MPLFHAVVWVDHHAAQVLQFDASRVVSQQVEAPSHHTRQDGGQLRSTVDHPSPRERMALARRYFATRTGMPPCGTRPSAP